MNDERNNEEDFLSLVLADEHNRSGSDKNGNDDVEATATEAADKREDSGPDYRNKYNKLPPWMEKRADNHQTAPLVALHNEIVSFCRLMEPRKEEIETRKDLVKRFTDLAKATFPDCKVEVFGSQQTGLYLPTSDIDIAIQLNKDEEKKLNGGECNESDSNNKDESSNSKKKTSSKKQEKEDMDSWNFQQGNEVSPLKRLAEVLREKWIDDLSYLEVIENTRVPLVKFTDEKTNIMVDVCFSQSSGVQSAALMKRYMNAIPPLRPLTFVLKKFLASRGLNEPYTGGCGSFLLQLMIVAFLQHREKDCLNRQSPSIYNLGALLVEFFEFYSTDFNYVLTGISIRFDGFFFPKGAIDRKKVFWQPHRPFSIAMENPLDPSLDVGTSSFRIDLIQRSFDVAFKNLLCHVSEPVIAPPSTSILATVLAPSEEMWERRTTDNNHEEY